MEGSRLEASAGRKKIGLGFPKGKSQLVGKLGLLIVRPYRWRERVLGKCNRLYVKMFGGGRKNIVSEGWTARGKSLFETEKFMRRFKSCV